jgi:hypothetical protein
LVDASPGRPRIPLLRLAAALLLAAGAASPLLARDLRIPVPSRLGPVDLSAEWATASRSGNTLVISAGGVTVRWEGAVLTAERAVVWASPPAGQPLRIPGGQPLEAAATLAVTVYAEGGVRVEFQGDILTCERFLFDFGARRGVLHRARADLFSAFGKTSVSAGSRLVARAEEIRIALEKDGGGTVTLRDASLTDCEFIEPHYDFAATEVRVEIRGGKDGPVWVTLWNLMPRAFGVPLFWVPVMKWNADWRPMIRIKPGHSDQFGWFLRTGVGLEVKAPKPGNSDRERRIATFWALGDDFEKRGPAAGFEGKWQWPGEFPFRGEALLYYVHDRGDDRPIARALGWDPPPREDRWRTFLYHRQSAPSLGARIDLEINAASDANFLREFYEHEVRTDKPPESYLQVLEAWANHAGTLLVRPRLNEYQTAVEELPRLTYRGISQPLPYGAGVLDVGLMADHARLRPDDRDPALRSARLWRFDGWAEWALPFRFLEVQVEPFLRARYSAFERSAAGDRSIDREVLEAGVRTSVQAWRDFDTKAPALGVNGLRHVVSLHADYLDRCVVTTPPSDLVPIDDLERVDLVRRVDLRLLNRLATWPAGAPASTDVLFLEIGTSLYPDRDRDNGGKWWGPASCDLRFRPGPWAGFEAFAVYDLDRGAFDRWDAGLWVAPWSGTRISVATTNTSGSVHSMTARASVRFDARWTAEFEEMYDFERGRQVSASLRVRRTLHCWVLEVGIHREQTKKDVGITVTFMPLLAGS